MTDLVPTNHQISRKALERIIQRAAELQAAERDLGDHLSEDQVLELGREVGLPARYVQQAILEERTRTAIGPEGGRLARLMGPVHVSAQRTVAGDKDGVEEALEFWMVEKEILTVKRRFHDQTSWEPRRDWVASVRRGFGYGGRSYALSRTREVVGHVQALEPGWCHVTLAADLTNSRNEYLGGATALAGVGGTAAVIAGVIGVALPLAVLPAVAGVAVGLVTARSRRSAVERVQVALEQVLDKLEHGEIEPTRSAKLPPGSQISKVLRDELRKHLS